MCLRDILRGVAAGRENALARNLASTPGSALARRLARRYLVDSPKVVRLLWREARLRRAA